MSMTPVPPYPFQAEPMSCGELTRRLGLGAPKTRTDALIGRVGSLHDAKPDSLVYCQKMTHLEALGNCEAQFCLMTPETAAKIPDELRTRLTLILSDRPKFTWAQAAKLLFPDYPNVPSQQPQAVIADTVRMGDNAVIDANCVIEDNVVIGANVVIRNSFIGKNCIIGDNAVLHHCRLGESGVICPGVVIGAEGFGVIPASDAHPPVDIPQLGTVDIGKNCIIGANSAIDRATIGMTQIGNHNKIDNLVQIGHNVTIGSNCLIASSCAIAGSCKIGHNVVISGLCGVIDNITIADGVEIGGGSAVFKDVLEPHQRIWGNPARQLTQQARLNALLSKRLRKS